MESTKSLEIGEVVGDNWTVTRKQGLSCGKRIYMFQHICGDKLVTTAESIKAGRKCYACCGEERPNRCRRKVETLCWSCKNAVCGCSWSKTFTPVDGWEAIPTTIKYNDITSYSSSRITSSFIVLSCPQYEKDPPKNTKHTRRKGGNNNDKG